MFEKPQWPTSQSKFAQPCPRNLNYFVQIRCTEAAAAAAAVDLCAVYLGQAAFVPSPLEAQLPVRGHVRPEAPQSAQLLQLPGWRLPGEEHAGVQQAAAVQQGQQKAQTEHTELLHRDHCDAAAAANCSVQRTHTHKQTAFPVH